MIMINDLFSMKINHENLKDFRFLRKPLRELSYYMKSRNGFAKQNEMIYHFITLVIIYHFITLVIIYHFSD